MAETLAAGGEDRHHAVTDPAAEAPPAGARLHVTAMIALNEGTTEGTAEGADNAPDAAVLSDLHGPRPDAQGRVPLTLGDPLLPLQ